MDTDFIDLKSIYKKAITFPESHSDTLHDIGDPLNNGSLILSAFTDLEAAVSLLRVRSEQIVNSMMIPSISSFDHCGKRVQLVINKARCCSYFYFHEQQISVDIHFPTEVKVSEVIHHGTLKINIRADKRGNLLDLTLK